MATPETFDDIGIINQALTRMGEEEISNLEGPDKPSLVMRKNYRQVTEAALTHTAWRFATAKKALNKLSGTPVNRWEAAWALPPDKLKVLFVYPANNYEIQGRNILTNKQAELEIDYIRYVLEGEWPPWFREYVIARLVVATVKGITGDDPSTEQRDAHKDARSDALWQDAQQQPNFTDLPNPFIDCRF